MSQDVAGTIQSTMTGATLAGGFFSFVAQYQSEITTLAIATTCVGSVVFGIWGKINESRRNKINKMMIKRDIIKEIEDTGVVTKGEILMIKDELNID